MKRVALLLAPAAALLLSACAGAPPAAPPPGASGGPGAAPFATLASRFSSRALKQEAAGDLRLALDSWKVVAALRPGTDEPKRRIADLSARIAANVERLFRDGTARLRDGNVDAARRAFLLSLAYDPDHAGALDALRDLLEPDATPYTVNAGDTFESIAKMQYDDAAKGPLVARVNNLDPAGTPAPGTVLALPNLAPPAAKPPVKRAPEAVAETPEAPDSADDTEPAALGDESQPAALAAVERRKKEKAEELYNAGVSFFINQKLDEAILSWERTLALNPDHPKAPKDIAKARGLQQKLKELR